MSNVTISPMALEGTVAAIPSKTYAHRAIMLAALAASPTELIFSSTSEDIDATLDCVGALGAKVTRTQKGATIYPIEKTPADPVLDCAESGTTLRLLVPIVAAITDRATFKGRGRLPLRPMKALTDALENCGVSFEGSGLPLATNGKFTGGKVHVSGNISSQYVSGLLLALPIAGGGEIVLTSPLVSAGYVDVTIELMGIFGIDVERTAQGFKVEGKRYTSPSVLKIEGDWSNAAFFLVAGALKGPITVTGLRSTSLQRDKQIVDILKLFGADVQESGDEVTVRSGGTLKPIIRDIDATIDLAPILAVLASCASGKSTFTGAARLRDKESDRVQAILEMLFGVGIDASADENALYIEGQVAMGGKVNAMGDHRIAMAGAVLASIAQNDTIIEGAQAVNKSYPAFFEDFKLLGGKTNGI